MTELLDWVTTFTLVRVFGMGLLAFAAGGVVGFLHRSYTNSLVPFYAPVIVGLGAVGLWINGANVLITFVSNMGEEVVEPVALTHIETNVLTAIVGGFAAYGGGRAGDRLAPNVRALVGAKQVNVEVNKLVKTVGRFITVTVPDNIQTIDGYDPITDETRSKIAGREFVFSRGLTVPELRKRITDRLREDYGVGHVDVEVDEEGKITYLAVGRRIAGIGPTLPPRRVALAVTGNPPPKASPGDLVQLWELPEEEDETETAESETTDAESETTEVETADSETTEGTDSGPEGGSTELPPALLAHPDQWYRPDSDRYAFAVRTPDGGRRYRQTADSAAALVAEFYREGPSTDEEASIPPTARRVAQAELRATNGDVATVVVDRNRLDHVDQSSQYRLVTLPSDKKPENEFASLLRAANETMETVTVESESDLAGIPVGALRPSVVAVRPPDAPVETLPGPGRRCEPGETLYVIGRPDQLRKLSAASEA